MATKGLVLVLPKRRTEHLCVPASILNFLITSWYSYSPLIWLLSLYLPGFTLVPASWVFLDTDLFSDVTFLNTFHLFVFFVCACDGVFSGISRNQHHCLHIHSNNSRYGWVWVSLIIPFPSKIGHVKWYICTLYWSTVSGSVHLKPSSWTHYNWHMQTFQLQNFSNWSL